MVGDVGNSSLSAFNFSITLETDNERQKFLAAMDEVCFDTPDESVAAEMEKILGTHHYVDH